MSILKIFGLLILKLNDCWSHFQTKFIFSVFKLIKKLYIEHVVLFFKNQFIIKKFIIIPIRSRIKLHIDGSIKLVQFIRFLFNSIQKVHHMNPYITLLYKEIWSNSCGILWLFHFYQTIQTIHERTIQSTETKSFADSFERDQKSSQLPHIRTTAGKLSVYGISHLFTCDVLLDYCSHIPACIRLATQKKKKT